MCRVNEDWRLHLEVGIHPEVEGVWDNVQITSIEDARKNPDFPEPTPLYGRVRTWAGIGLARTTG